MSDAYDFRNTHTETDRCGCGAGLLPFPVDVVHADTGRLITRFCRRCAADLLAPSAAARSPLRPARHDVPHGHARRGHPGNA
ncbi:MAG: hypothetical protein JNM75_06875 [Rhodospirillales bacterium]|nr:hypothetical protein [Rhodospirillales bacterium]